MKMQDRKSRLSRILRDFPWLWAICSNWENCTKVQVTQVTNTDFFNWSLDCSDGLCYFHVVRPDDDREAVYRIQVPRKREEIPQRGRFRDAVRMFVTDYGSLLHVVHIAVLVKGQGIQVFRPKGKQNFRDLHFESRGYDFTH